jgi:hypothetical protein
LLCVFVCLFIFVFVQFCILFLFVHFLLFSIFIFLVFLHMFSYTQKVMKRFQLHNNLY